MQMKAAIGFFVVAPVIMALVAVMVVRSGMEPVSSADEASEFEAWEGAENQLSEQEVGGEPDEAAAGDAREVDADLARENESPARARRASSAEGTAKGEAKSAPDETSGESDDAAAGERADRQGGEGPERDDQGAERKAGTLSEEVLRETIESVRPIVRQCYLDALEDFPDAEGRVMLQFEIISENGEGRVAMTEIGEDSTLYESSLHDCLQLQISEVVFESPGEDAAVNVTYPFNFAQGEGAGEAGASNP